MNAATRPQTPPIVLVIDDDPINLTLAVQLLQAQATVRVANSGEQGLRLASATPPDLVLLDIEMPGLDGYATCARLKADPKLAHVPVIFLTARASAEDETRGLELGAADYIHKPFSPPVLKARVATQISLKRALQEARSQRAKADAMLEVVLPPPAAKELRETHTVAPRCVDDAVVLFADVVGFTAWCDSHPPASVVSHLHALFLDFEAISHRHGVEKLKTIGDAYMAGLNLLTQVEDPLMCAVRCALEMISCTREHGPGWSLRVGIHTGPVVCGIVGGERFQYDIWGDTVNIAARLTGVARPNCIGVTASTLAGIHHTVNARVLGPRPIKGKGTMSIAEICDLAACAGSPSHSTATPRDA